MVSAVEGRANQSRPIHRRLCNGVRFRVNCPLARFVNHEMADIIAVSQAPGGSVVASGKNSPVSDHYTADVQPIAGAPRRHSGRDRKEVFIPRQSRDCVETRASRRAVRHGSSPFPVLEYRSSPCRRFEERSLLLMPVAPQPRLSYLRLVRP